MQLLDRRFFYDNFIVEGFISTPPVSPDEGIQYVVGSSPTGAFSGKEDCITVWDGYSWRFFNPQGICSSGVRGAVVLDNSTGRILEYRFVTNHWEWVVIAYVSKRRFFDAIPITMYNPSLPATAAIDDKVINSMDNKLYTATAVNTWDSGVAVPDGTYFEINDGDPGEYVYTYKNGVLVEEYYLEDGDIVFCPEMHDIYCRDCKLTPEFPPIPTLSCVPVPVTETFALTSAQISAHAVELTNAIPDNNPDFTESMLVFLNGVLLVLNEDFVYDSTNHSITWDSLSGRLASAIQNDQLVVHYYKAFV